MEKDYKPRCYRAEPRTIIPGIKVGEGRPGEYEQTEVFVVVEGATERLLGKSGTIYTRTTDIRTGDFFPHRLAAEQFACKKHMSTGCRSEECGWTAIVATFKDNPPPWQK